MPTVTELLEQGDLTEAIEQARRDLTERPRDEGLRFLFFELMALEENFEEAMVQLNMMREFTPDFAGASEFFLGLIEAEQARHTFLNGGESGVGFLVEPPGWASEFCQIPKLVAEGRTDAAADLLRKARPLVPTVSGTVNGDRAFTSLRDADDVLDPFLEAIAPGAWVLLPFSQLRSITFLPSRGYQDVIWRPAVVSFREGREVELWLPSNYSGSGGRTDLEKLGRLTMWDDLGPDLRRAYGQRDFMLDASGSWVTLMGIRNIQEILFD
jgi:type VI secretion system protein ImpE